MVSRTSAASTLVPLFCAGLILAQQTRTYRDPAGRFSVPVPPGWTASTAGDMTTLTSGATYGLIAVIDGGGADPNRVARFTDQFGQQWREYKRLQNGSARLGGSNGAFAIYSGVNPKGIDAVVKALSAPSGTAAYVLIFSCPVPEWESKKPAMEAIERGFVMGRPDGGARTSAPESQAVPAPRGSIVTPQNPPRNAGPAQRRELPAGFTVVGRNGATGQALTASFNGGQSARTTFGGVFKFIAPYFDGAPQLRAAFADARDREIQGFFHAVYQGVPVSGLMVLTVDNGKGYTSLLFDREDLFSQSLPGLTRQMTASLPAARSGGGGGAPRPPAPLTRTQLLDGSGFIGLPAGWRITGSFKGVVDAVGPNGEAASLGGYQSAFINPLPGTPANTMTGPYRPPAQALYLYTDILTQRGLSRGTATMRILEQAPVQAQNGQAAYISYEVKAGNQHIQGLAMVNTSPIDNTMWLFYMSVVQAPKERFAQELPTLWEIWKSWSVNPAVFRERMDAALQSMRDTFRILQESHDNTQRTYDNVNTAWDQVIRGVTTIENVVTQRRADVDTNSVDQVVRDLNEHGYQYRVVPLPELVR